MRLTLSVSPPAFPALRTTHSWTLAVLLWSVLLLAGNMPAWAAPTLRSAARPPGVQAKPRRIFAAAAPAAPSSLRVDYPGPTSIRLIWTSNSTNENSFAVERKGDGQPDSAFTPVGSADPVDSAGAQVTFTDSSGLNFDTVYNYRVRAIAVDGTPSPYSNTAAGTTAPAAPISLAVSVVVGSDSKLSLSWIDNARHTLYFQLWRKGPGETVFTNFANWGNNSYYGGGDPGKGVAFTYTNTGLTVSSAYSYYVIAYNQAGKSDPSNTAGATTNAAQVAPTAPSVGANAGSSGANGTDNPKTTIRAYVTDQSTNAATVTLQKINNDDPSSVYTNLPGYPQPVTGSVNTTYYSYDTGLPVDTSYSYRAYASNSKGDSPLSNVVTAATVPVKPISLAVAAVAGSDSKLSLSWIDNARHTLYFQLWRKGPGETVFTNFANWGNNSYYGGGDPGKGVAFTYTNTGLTVSSAYSYYVIAYNQAGQSDPSETVTGTTNTTRAAPVAPSAGANAGSAGVSGTDNPKTTIRAYVTDQSTNAATVTLQKINNDDASSVYTNLSGYPKAVTGGINTTYYSYDTGLPVDTSYSYRAFASNTAGDSPLSNVVTAATVPVKPISVSVSAVAGSDSKLTLSWVDNARHTLYFQLWRKGPGETVFTNFANWGNPSYYGGGDPGKGNAFTYVNTGLTVSSAYSYHVIAYNQAGQSDPSDTVTATTNAAQIAPTAPSVGANAGSSGADGKADPKTTIRAYVTDQSTNAVSLSLQQINNDDPGSVYTTVQTFPVTGSINTTYYHYDTGLLVDTSYSYRAYASNSKGDSPFSNIVTAATVPAKPISVQATPLSDTKIKLSWVDNARHTLYFQLWRKGPGETVFTNFANWGNNSYYGGGDPGKGVAFTYTNTGLTVSSAYSYYVIAYNQAGQSDPSETVTATTFPANPPGAPSDLRAAGAAGPSQINLNWLDNSTTEFGFIVERQAETETSFTALAGANPGDPTVGPSPGTGRVYYSDKTVKDDTIYTYRVKATNPAGESAYSNSIAAPTAPTAVTGLSAAAVAGTNDSIKLVWTSSSKHEDGFNVYRKAPGETAFTKRASVAAAAGPGSLVSFTDVGLTGSAAYSYYVAAYNSAGESAASSAVTATTGTVTPTTVTITSPADGAKFPVGGSIPVVVTATPAAGTTITSYTLLTNDVPATQVSGNFTLTGLAAGTYTLKAKAIDSAGNTATFPGITITVASQPPVITNAALQPATLPAAGGTLSVTATVTDPNGAGLSSIYASVLLDGTALTTITLSNGGSGSAYSGTYAVPANATGTARVYTAKVSAQNAAGLTSTADAAGSCTVASGNPVPTLSSLSPTSANRGATGFVLTLTGSGFLAGTTVSFGTLTSLVPVAGSLNATQLQVAVPDSALAAAGPVSVSVTNPAPAGGTSNLLTFTVTVPVPLAPVLQSASPGDGQVSLTFTTVANAATYTLKSSTQSGGPYATDVSGIIAPAGAATVTAADPNQANGLLKYYVVSAVGPAGESQNSNELSATPQQSNQPPVVTLTSPADGAALTAPASVTLTATASSLTGTIAQVEFFQDGGSVGVVKTAPYTLSITGLVNGTYVFKAAATAGNGASALSKTATVTVGNPAPGVYLLSGPADQSTVCTGTVVFSWFGYSSTTPTGQLRYEYQIDNSGAWSSPTADTSLTLNSLAEGVHTFALRLLNADGSVVGSPVSRVFFVSLTPPTLLAATVDARDTRAAVNWTTSKPTTGQVEFGTTASYGKNAPPNTVSDGAHNTTLAGLATQTTYHYRIHFTDGCHDVVTPDQSFTTTALLKANLEVTGATVPKSFAPLAAIPVSWTVLDSGPGDALGTWTDSVYLSTGPVLDAAAIKLGDFPVNGPILAYSSYTQSKTLTIPRVPAGRYYLIIQANATNVLPETATGDNTLAVSVELTTLQDLIVTPDKTLLTLKTAHPYTGTLTLTDLSLGTLSNLTATVTGVPANVTVQVTPPATLNSLESKTASYTITAADASVLSSAFQIVFASGGVKATATINLTIIPPTPRLLAAPLQLSAGMVRGGQRLVDFTVTNTGDATAKNLSLILPVTPWLSATTTALHGDLAPGATGTFELALTPAADLALGRYTGAVEIKGDNTGVSIPFAFNCISTNKGSLRIVAQDEYSFFADTHPNLSGAHVVLSDATTGNVVLDDITGADGTLSRDDVTEGDYNLEVTAAGHKPFHGALHLIAGQNNEIAPFLSRQLVTYTWTVVPIPFTDHYTVTLDAVFETHVPAPVVTVDPSFLDLRKVQFDSSGKAVVNYTLTNHGLIAANNAHIKLPSDSVYTITPYLTSLGTIGPLSSVIVPVTITRPPGFTPHGQAKARVAAHGLQPLDAATATICTLTGSADFTYDCGGPRFTSDELIFDTGEYACSDVSVIYTSADDGSNGGTGVIDAGGGDGSNTGDLNGSGVSVDGPPGINTDGGCFTPF